MADDFVVEVRPRSHHRIQNHTQMPEGFVSEIRCRSSENTVLKSFASECQGLNSMVAPKSIHSDYLESDAKSFNSGCHDLNCDVSDKDVENILSERHFSRENMTQLLEGSIITLVEKLLTGHQLRHIDGHLNIALYTDEPPIVVDLRKTFKRAQGNNYDYLTDLDHSFNVKIRDKDSPPSLLPLNESSYSASSPSHFFDREPCHSVESPSVEGSSSSPSLSSGFHTEMDASMSSPAHDDTRIVSSTPPVVETMSVPAATSERQMRRDSDEESGYTSNEKEDSDAASDRDHTPPPKRLSTFNDYYCGGFDGKNTVYIPEETDCERHEVDHCGSSGEGSDEMDDDDDEMDYENRLVIDENPMKVDEPSPVVEMTESHRRDTKMPQPVHREMEPVPSRRSLEHAPQCGEAAREYQVDETEDLDSPTSSDATDLDTDVPVDLSGDSKLSTDVVSVIPHPQGLVSKHPKGFKCKHCAQVLPDANAVSKHVHDEHDLYCCTYCCRTFTAKNNLKRHVRLHTGLRPYKCSQCTQSFARRDDLKGHMLRHDYSKPFRCSLCKKGYTDRACVKNHMAKEHRSRLMHVCPQCGESFDRDDAFTAHKKSHPELQQFSCKTCSFIGINNLMTLKHSLLHNHKLFSCKPCNAYFADPFDYTNHVRKHKKTSTFTQYVCCFCDVALATYDQYVRHEYSHAQGKTHACKLCKKQFKSKSLLHDHALSHQTPIAKKFQMEHPSSSSADTDKNVRESSSLSVAPQSTETRAVWAQDTHEAAEPVDFSSAAQEDDIDEFHGELLDLSLKKPSSPTFHKEDLCDPQGACGNFSSRQGPSGLTGKCIPRNGYAPESFGLRQEREVSDRVFASYQSFQAEDGTEKTYKPVFNVRENNIIANPSSKWNHIPDSLRGMDTLSITKDQGLLHPKPVYPERPRSAERNRVSSHQRDSSAEGSRSLNRSISSGYNSRTPLRFSPYTREKMADLAVKFVAARGPKVSPKIALKSIMQHRDERKVMGNQEQPALMSNPWKLQEKRAPVMMNGTEGFRSNQPSASSLRGKEEKMLSSTLPHVMPAMSLLKDNVDRSREDSDPETALRCHIPTFVKSEPLLEKDLASEAALNGSLKVEDLNNNLRAMKGNGPHPCDLCKEEFVTFADLESHSVEIHKRYLCEHCGKSFTARPNRDRHVRYHTGERPYKCDLCDMAFFRGDDLKYHRTTRHPTAQPFVCSRCSATFTWGRDLERHIRHSKCKA